MLPLPSNVSKFNRFRLIPLDSTNPNDVGIFAIVAARDTIPQLVGMATLTFDPHMWAGTPETADEMAEYFMNNALITELCDAVADCIQNSPAVREAIAKAVGTSGGYNEPTSDSGFEFPVRGILDEELLTELMTCDTDSLYGTLVAMLDDMSQAVLDALELVAAAAAGLNRVAQLADQMPGTRFNPAANYMAAAAELADALADTVYTIYEAALSETVIQNLACDVLCALNDCEMSLDTLRNTISSASPFSPNDDDDLIDALTAIADAYLLTLTPTEYVALGIQIVIEALARGGAFGTFVSGAKSLQQLALLHADETSDDWSILCNQCGLDEWIHTIDFTASDGDFILTQSQYGVYVVGTGWQTTQPVSAYRLETLKRELASPYRQTRLTLEYDAPAAPLSNNIIRINLRKADNTLIKEAEFQPFDAGVGQSVIMELEYLDVSVIEIEMFYNKSGAGQNGTLTRLEIHGRGINPFI